MLSAYILMLLQVDLDTWIRHYNEKKDAQWKILFWKNGRSNIPGLNSDGQRVIVEQHLTDRRSMFVRLGSG